MFFNRFKVSTLKSILSFIGRKKFRSIGCFVLDFEMQHFSFSNKASVLCVKATCEIYFIRDHWEHHSDAITTFNHTIVFAEDRKSFASTNQNKNLYWRFRIIVICQIYFFFFVWQIILHNTSFVENREQTRAQDVNKKDRCYWIFVMLA